MIIEVVKGTDDRIEFYGFKGRYVKRIFVYVGGLMALTFSLYMMGFSSILFLVIALGLGVAGFFYIKLENDRNQKFGHIHKKYQPPKSIIQDQPFYKFLK